MNECRLEHFLVPTEQHLSCQWREKQTAELYARRRRRRIQSIQKQLRFRHLAFCLIFQSCNNVSECLLSNHVNGTFSLRWSRFCPFLLKTYHETIFDQNHSCFTLGFKFLLLNYEANVRAESSSSRLGPSNRQLGKADSTPPTPSEPAWRPLNQEMAKGERRGFGAKI